MRPLTRVYHMTEAANWASIQHDGLLSASALMAAAEIAESERVSEERRQRRSLTVLPNGALIRDQSPMPPAALARCLVGLAPEDWYALLNHRVFFWIDPARLNRHRQACAARPQVVLTVDAERLIAAYGECIELTPINTGNARRQPAKRGAASFVPYAVWQSSGWASEAASLGTRPRPRSHAPVEMTIAEAVPDVLSFVIDVQELAPGQPFVPNVT